MKNAQLLASGQADRRVNASPLVLSLSRALVAGFVASVTMVVAFAPLTADAGQRRRVS